MMWLRNLKYPICVQGPNSLMGGRAAGLDTPRSWRGNVADYYLTGGFSGSIIVDATGQKFQVRQVILNRLGIWDHIVATITSADSNSELANVDMELEPIGQYTLEEFCDSYRKLALENPQWWSRHSSHEEIEAMFDGCKTFKAAINDIGVLDVWGNSKAAKNAPNVRDLR